jgi:hypothetical protein
MMKKNTTYNMQKNINYSGKKRMEDEDDEHTKDAYRDLPAPVAL